MALNEVLHDVKDEAIVRMGPGIWLPGKIGATTLLLNEMHRKPVPCVTDFGPR